MLLIAIYISNYSHMVDDPAMTRQPCTDTMQNALGRPNALTRRATVFPNRKKRGKRLARARKRESALSKYQNWGRNTNIFPIRTADIGLLAPKHVWRSRVRQHSTYTAPYRRVNPPPRTPRPEMFRNPSGTDLARRRNRVRPLKSTLSAKRSSQRMRSVQWHMAPEFFS